jgi:hypothetical protein
MRAKYNKILLCPPVSMLFLSSHWLSVSVTKGHKKGKHGLVSMHAAHIPHGYALLPFYDIILVHGQL